MRIVADTNVLVSAALGRSPQAPSVLILEAVLDGRIEIVLSPALLAEIAEVLLRPRVARYVSSSDAERFLAGLASLGRIVADVPDPPSVCRDADDDYLLALARTVGADALVTGDDDLLALDHGSAGVLVVTPRELLHRIP